VTTPIRGWYVNEIIGIGIANLSGITGYQYESVLEDELGDCTDFTFDNTENDGAMNE
jgi:hypothetical protein